MRKLLSLLLTAVLCMGLTVPAAAHNTARVGSYTTVSSNSSTTLAVMSDNTLWEWGRTRNWNISHGAPEKVMDGVVSVYIGEILDYKAVIKTDGTLWMQGYNYYGALGDGTYYDSDVLKKVQDNVAAVSGGYSHTAIIKTDGSLWTWGLNNCGQLGNGTLENSCLPVKIMDDVIAVSCGSHHTAAIKSDGTLWMWGANYWGQLGDTGIGDNKGWNGACQTTPVKIMEDVVFISCGADTSAAIKGDGSLWVWCSYVPGDGTVGTMTTPPTKIMDDVASVNCGNELIGAIKTDGSLWMWGRNDDGSVGNGGEYDYERTTRYTGSDRVYHSYYQTVPVKVINSGVAAVICKSVGFGSTIALKTDGSVWVWGLNNDAFNNLGSADIWNDTAILNGSEKHIQTVPAMLISGGVALPASVPTTPTVAGFTDVHESDYFAGAVSWAVDNGVTSGTTKTTFSPYASVTRAQAVTFMWRAAGCPEPVSKTSPFTDVADASAYYYKPILWAAEKGITSGVSKTLFGVNSPVAYDQMFAFLARFAGADTGSGDWSANAISWANSAGLTDGLSFTAKAACPRADVVYALWRQLG